MTKQIKRHFQKLTAQQVAEYRALKHSQEIAWATRNKPLATELGLRIAELRHENLAYRNLKY
jgi:hypothetical protein